MQAVYVAVNMNYHILHKSSIQMHILCYSNLIVIFTAYMHRGGKRGEIWNLNNTLFAIVMYLCDL